MTKYRTILIDPPWPQDKVGRFARHSAPAELPYETMDMDGIRKLPVGDMADEGCHLWLWTTNQFLHEGFHLLELWGFRYLAPVTWVKPSGLGAWFVHRTQTCLMGYRPPCRFEGERYKPTVIVAGLPRRHSEKPEEAYRLIEAVSSPPRVELFARAWHPLFPIREGWDVWGNEVPSTVDVAAPCP